MAQNALAPSYIMILDAPPALKRDDYEVRLFHQWRELLNSDRQSDEAVFQDFLEQHPCLLPRPLGTHGPIHSVLISQPELTGLKAKRPDFMWISKNRVEVFVDLIEIEAPAKPWQNKDGRPSAKLIQAIDQLHEWKAWFRDERNVQRFKADYQILENVLFTRSFSQHYTLIYGREDEATSTEAFAKKRVDYDADDQTVMSYDRLKPDPVMMHHPTVRLDRSGPDVKLKMIHIPPTFKLGPNGAEFWAQLTNREETIRRNPWLSLERKEFLLKRLPYWDAWSTQPKRIEFIGGRDGE